MITLSNYNRSIDLKTMPDRIRRLPISETGYPVPWFVVWFDENRKPCEDGQGTPDFRVANPAKIVKAVNQKKCWVCGGQLGIFKSWCIGSMCAINRVISEPPSHRECAIWSARQCPFLSKPNMVRNEKGMYRDDGTPVYQEAAGLALKRNPGAVCVWITKTFRPFQAELGQPGVLFSLGKPEEVLWFAEGRRATRAQVMASIDSGYPLLQEAARKDGKAALDALAVQRETAMQLVPAE